MLELLFYLALIYSALWIGGWLTERFPFAGIFIGTICLWIGFASWSKTSGKSYQSDGSAAGFFVKSAAVIYVLVLLFLGVTFIGGGIASWWKKRRESYDYPDALVPYEPPKTVEAKSRARSTPSSEQTLTANQAMFKAEATKASGSHEPESIQEATRRLYAQAPPKGQSGFPISALIGSAFFAYIAYEALLGPQRFKGGDALFGFAFFAVSLALFVYSMFVMLRPKPRTLGDIAKEIERRRASR